MKMWAVDPGGVHVGFAEFEYVPTGREDGEDWGCNRAWEKDPDNAIDDIAAALLQYRIDVLVVEEFRLYPDKALEQTGSTMPTCELIGQIKWAHRLDSQRRRKARDAVVNARSGRKRTDTLALNAEIPLVLQPAAIQAPTQGVLRKRGVKSVAKANRAQIRQAWVDAGLEPASSVGDHAFSAELHGWHWILRGQFKE